MGARPPGSGDMDIEVPEVPHDDDVGSTGPARTQQQPDPGHQEPQCDPGRPPRLGHEAHAIGRVEVERDVDGRDIEAEVVEALSQHPDPGMPALVIGAEERDAQRATHGDERYWTHAARDGALPAGVGSETSGRPPPTVRDEEEHVDVPRFSDPARDLMRIEPELAELGPDVADAEEAIVVTIGDIFDDLC